MILFPDLAAFAPDTVVLETAAGRFTLSGGARAARRDVAVVYEGGRVLLTAGETGVSFVSLHWAAELPRGCRSSATRGSAATATLSGAVSRSTG